MTSLIFDLYSFKAQKTMDCSFILHKIPYMKVGGRFDDINYHNDSILSFYFVPYPLYVYSTLYKPGIKESLSDKGKGN